MFVDAQTKEYKILWLTFKNNSHVSYSKIMPFLKSKWGHVMKDLQCSYIISSE